MADYQLVSKQEHRNLRVATHYSAEFGHNTGAAMVVDAELRSAQREYPIVFRKHPETGQFIPHALLGFKEDENLFLDGEGGWLARHVPLTLARGPFSIGVQEVDNQSYPSASIDLADPRVSENGEGEALFREDGSLTRFMDNMGHMLALLQNSAKSVKQMGDLFVELDLIEPLRLDIEFVNGEKLRFEGGYTVAEEKLAALDEKALKKLHESGFLAAAYFIACSLDNVSKLIEIKNRSLPASPDARNG